MSRIYLAGPLFCESEREYNRAISAKLRKAGFEVVLPQECAPVFVESRMCEPEYATESAEKVFRADLEHLESCDIVVINLDGRVPDEGACIELGYAFAKGKRVFGIKTDVRIAEYGIDNMMITGMLRGRVARSAEELISLIKA